MSENKYIEKIAGPRFDKAVGFATDLFGGSARRLRAEAEVSARHAAKGITPGMAQNAADEAAKRTLHARVKTGIGAGVVGTAGFLGIHKYQQHKDNAILAKIDQMYADQSRAQE